MSALLMNTTPLLNSVSTTVRAVPFEVAIQHIGPGPIALDLETYSINYPASDEALDPRQGEIRLVSLCSEGGEPQLTDHMRWPVVAEQLAALLEGRTVLVHNAPFECSWLETKFGIKLRPKQIFDTLVAERILTNGLGISNSLGPTLARELDLSIPKELGVSFGAGWFLTSDQELYAANDVRFSHRLAARQSERLESEGLGAVFDLELALLPVASHMEKSGFQVDPDILRQVETQSENETRRLKKLIWSHLDPRGELNIDSPEQLASALAFAGPPVTDTKEVTLACLDDPVAGLILDYRAHEM
jgi:DNA polymerase I-like protein with 3'-5' exonuclease and polymerase domains